MKLYVTGVSPYTLMEDTMRRIQREDHSMWEDRPDYDLDVADYSGGRSVGFGWDARTARPEVHTGYWRADLSLFAFTDQHPVFSPYYPASRHVTDRYGYPGSGLRAATHDQWGVVLGALLDEALDRHGDGVRVRLTGTYDPLAKHSLRREVVEWRDAPSQERRAQLREGGVPLADSWEVFTYHTAGQFSAEQRRRGNPDLRACTRHKWGWRTQDDGTAFCEKCGRLHRFYVDRKLTADQFTRSDLRVAA